MKLSDLKVPASKPIAFHAILAIKLGSINAAIYLQQFLYWYEKGKRADGFIYKTKNEIQAETTLTRDQQDKVRKELVRKGLMETKLLKANAVPTLHYRLNLRLVEKALTD